MSNQFEVFSFTHEEFQLAGRKPWELIALHKSVMRATRDIRLHSQSEAQSFYARWIKQHYPTPGRIAACRLQWLATIRRAYQESAHG